MYIYLLENMYFGMYFGERFAKIKKKKKISLWKRLWILWESFVLPHVAPSSKDIVGR